MFRQIMRVSTGLFLIGLIILFTSCGDTINSISKTTEAQNEDLNVRIEGNWQLVRTTELDQNPETTFLACIPYLPRHNHIAINKDTLWFINYPENAEAPLKIRVTDDSIYCPEKEFEFSVRFATDTLILSLRIFDSDIIESYHYTKADLDSVNLRYLKYCGVGWDFHRGKWELLYEKENEYYNVTDDVEIPEFIDLTESNKNHFRFSKDTLIYNTGKSKINLHYYYTSALMVFIYPNSDGTVSSPISYERIND